MPPAWLAQVTESELCLMRALTCKDEPRVAPTTWATMYARPLHTIPSTAQQRQFSSSMHITVTAQVCSSSKTVCVHRPLYSGQYLLLALHACPHTNGDSLKKPCTCTPAEGCVAGDQGGNSHCKAVHQAVQQVVQQAVHSMQYSMSPQQCCCV
jgi:hypothetical protein